MRFLVLNTDYSEFISWLYTRNPGLEKKPYDEQMRVRMDSLFGVADFYTSNLRSLGYEAWDVHSNNEFMQKAWARDHAVPIDESTSIDLRARALLEHAGRLAARTPIRFLKPFLSPMVRSLNGRPAWSYEILASQIEHYRPDVLLNQAIDGLSGRFLKEMKPHVGLLVGQVASPLPQGDDFGCYDLIISSLTNFVDYFRRIGISAELHQFGFEPAILSRLGGQEKKYAVSFVGSLSLHHESRIRWLEYLCKCMEIEVWGYGVEALPADSWIRRRYKGGAWGIEMYQILHQSKITLNHHIGVAGPYANNMRLFEAAGVGSLLVTDWKVNLNHLFQVGKEVAAYRNPEECVELIRHYLDHDEERKRVARAGQECAIREHSYGTRMEELVEIVRKYL